MTLRPGKNGFEALKHILVQPYVAFSKGKPGLKTDLLLANLVYQIKR